MTHERYQAALAAFDQANAQDTNKEMADGKEYPKELLYAQRMSEMQGVLLSLAAEPAWSERLQAATRALVAETRPRRLPCTLSSK